MRSPVNVTYDVTNGAHNIYCAVMANDTQTKLEVMCFPTHLQAMHYYKPEIQGEWKNVDGRWSAELKNQKGPWSHVMIMTLVFLDLGEEDGPSDSRRTKADRGQPMAE